MRDPWARPGAAKVEQDVGGRNRTVRLKWRTAFAGDEPIVHYQVLRDRQKVVQVAHQPRTRSSLFHFEEALSDKAAHQYRIVTVDAAGRAAATEDAPLPAV